MHIQVLILVTYMLSESLVATKHLVLSYGDSLILSKLRLLHVSCNNSAILKELTIIEINTGANSNALPFAAVTMIFGIPFTLLEGNACDHLRYGSCPALIGNRFIFSLLFEVPTLLPPVIFK